MKKWAMILLGRVIGVENGVEAPNWPPDPDGNPVTSTECDDTVYIGMYYHNGEFLAELPPEPLIPYQPTEFEQMLMATQAEMYEMIFVSSSVNMQSSAAIYEAVTTGGTV